MDYSVFDSFLSRDTWHTNHDNDLFVFYRCLQQVVDDPHFNPESMGHYIKTKKKISTDDHPLAGAVGDLVSNAWAVRDYFTAIRQ